jgi:hypothetical protein
MDEVKMNDDHMVAGIAATVFTPVAIHVMTEIRIGRIILWALGFVV